MTKRQPTATCPHCARQFRGHAALHRVCPEDPALRARIIAVMEDPDNPGTARKTWQYRDIAVAAGAPSLTTMQKHFGGWEATVTHYGLVCDNRCPHCTRPMQDAAHPARCPMHPARAPLVLAALEDPANPGHAVGPMTYERRRLENGAPSYDALRGSLGGWRSACEAFGLVYRGKRAREDRAIAEVAAAVDEDRELQRELAGHGLEVCRVRSLPDGRVACMLR